MLQNISINCDSLTGRKCWLQGTDAIDDTFENLDALTTYTIQCQVWNAENASDIRNVNVTTEELGKHFSRMNLQKVWTSTNLQVSY